MSEPADPRPPRARTEIDRLVDRAVDPGAVFELVAELHEIRMRRCLVRGDRDGALREFHEGERWMRSLLQRTGPGPAREELLRRIATRREAQVRRLGFEPLGGPPPGTAAGDDPMVGSCGDS
ncbi:MAG: hypothetical protein IT457_16940 [Planctomycetes bacterium]|nr:hypothetical protein [Planctomycetota bacterium]